MLIYIYSLVASEEELDCLLCYIYIIKNRRMVKIKCEVCEREEAEVLCCADEAVLCRKCDQRVHAANKLSSRHHRLSLFKLNTSSRSPSLSLSSGSAVSNLPLCDRCKERSGYVFCLEERALLCKTCDESTHMGRASPALLAHHQRFLIAGLKVSSDPVPMVGVTLTSSSSPSSNFTRQEEFVSDASLMLTTDPASGAPADQLEPSWPLDEIFGTEDFDASDYSDIKSCS